MLEHLVKHIHHNVALKGERDGLKSGMIETISSRASVTEEGSETMYAESTTASQHWTRENLAWMAGIFEGEGYSQGRPRTYERADGRKFTTVGLRLSISMTDEDVVRTFAHHAGVGNVNGPRVSPSALTRKPLWDFTAHGADAYALMVAMWTWLCQRRRDQFQTAIQAWLQSPGSSRAALNHEQVRRIRREVPDGPRGTASGLAREFGVSHGVVSLVVTGKTYSNVRQDIVD